jgi:hypothetical protein
MVTTGAKTAAQLRYYPYPKTNPMTYMQNLEQELHARLESFASGDLSAKDFIGYVKQTVLDSYRNGAVANRPEPPASAERQVAQDFRNEKRSGQAPFRRQQYYKR